MMEVSDGVTIIELPRVEDSKTPSMPSLLSSPSLSPLQPTVAPEERRAFEILPPLALIPSSKEIELKSQAGLFSDFDSLSNECKQRGPQILIKQRRSGWYLSVFKLNFVVILIAILIVISYNLACKDDSKVARVIGIVFHKSCIVIAHTIGVFYILFIHYPVVTFKWKPLFICCFLASVFCILYVAEWAMFKTKEDYFINNNKEGSQVIITFFADFLGDFLLFLGTFEFARYYWNHYYQNQSNTTTATKKKKFLTTQSQWCHFLTYILQGLTSLGVILSAFGLVSYSYARVFALGILPFGIILMLYTISHKVISLSLSLNITFIFPFLSILTTQLQELCWSSGFAIIFASLQWATITLANLLPTIMSIGGESGTFFSLVKFLCFYISNGIVFSAIQIVVARMTENYQTPQFMYIMQLFLDAFVSMSFVELQTVSQFWTLLIVEVIWSLFRNTGLYNFTFLYVKDFILEKIRQKKQEHSLKFLIERDEYFYLLNMQGMISGFQAALIIPVIMVIDAYLPFGACSISCVFNKADLKEFVIRYSIILSVKIALAFIVFWSYAIRYTIKVFGKNQTDIYKILLTAKSLWTSFSLHVHRNIVLFIDYSLFLYAYMLKPIISDHGFGNSSSN